MVVLDSTNQSMPLVISVVVNNTRIHMSNVANFSSSGHGKGEVDAAAGFLKSAARRAIMCSTDKAIRCAQDLYDFAVDHLSVSEPQGQLHKRRFFVSRKVMLTDNESDQPTQPL